MPQKLTPSKKTIWISWDFSLRGDYNNLYSWLNKNGAKECGDSSAVIISDRFVKEDIPEMIKAELQRSVKLNDNDRIYVVYVDDESGKTKGKFLFGGRKRNPWEGYGAVLNDKIEDVEE